MAIWQSVSWVGSNVDLRTINEIGLVSQAKCLSHSPAYRSLTYGLPNAFGATARPMKPASSTTVRTYGRA